MKFLLAFVLIAIQIVLIQAAGASGGYTIFYFSEPDCSFESYVNERESRIGQCNNYFYDNQLEEGTPCAESLQCLQASEPTSFCNDVFSGEAKAVFTGGDGFFFEIGTEICSANRDFEIIEAPFRTCIPSYNYQGCFIRIVPAENIESQSSASTLMAPILFIALVAFLF